MKILINFIMGFIIITSYELSLSIEQVPKSEGILHSHCMQSRQAAKEAAKYSSR